ncbi:MAG TPA: aldose 1-epimerase family protein [Steroidobacteraceae bacterium]
MNSGPTQHPWVHLSSGDLTAEINPLGAQLSSLRDRAARDLLWDGDPAVWAGRAPLLFPIVGVLAGGSYRLGSKTYHLSRHGFARDKLFSIEKTTASTAVFRLSADEASFQVYPFRFELDVHFELTGPTLSMTTWVRNKGDEDMPASCGYHPAFRWPLPFGQQRSSHFIEFETDEPAPIRRIDSAGLLTPERQPTPIAHRRLALTDALFQEDVVIFDQIKSRSVLYGGKDGPRIQVSFPDAPFLGVWTKPGAQFICIEPWHGVTDSAGFSGNFKDKAGVFVIAAGEAFSTKMAITLTER